MRVSYKASAPGSLMLLGEHAVLHGRSALACAVDTRMHVTLKMREDNEINIRSTLGKAKFTIENIEAGETLRFVTASITHYQGELKTGFDLDIHSEFTHQAGLGSSAAVTVATCAALRASIKKSNKPAEILEDSIAVIRDVQGVGSGADAAASVYGGIVLFKSDPISAKKLQGTHPLTVIFSGTKVSTVEVVKEVDALHARLPEEMDMVFDIMGKSAEHAAAAIEEGRWQTVGDLLNLNQGLMDGVGVSSGKLAGILYALRKDPGMLATKISGSGRGDCVIGLGSPSLEAFSYQQLPLAITSVGLTVTG